MPKTHKHCVNAFTGQHIRYLSPWKPWDNCKIAKGEKEDFVDHIGFLKPPSKCSRWKKMLGICSTQKSRGTRRSRNNELNWGGRRSRNNRYRR